MEFARPLLLLLVPLAGVVLWVRLKRGGDPAAFRHPRLELLGQQSTGIRARLAGALPVLSGLGLVLLIIAAAGPRVAHQSAREVRHPGVAHRGAYDGVVREDRVGAAPRGATDPETFPPELETQTHGVSHHGTPE